MTDQQPPAEMPPASESSEPPTMPAEMPADMAPAADAPEPMMAPAAPAPSAPSGWVQPAAVEPAAPGGQWVMPPAAVAATLGPVSGLARLGAFVLIVFGVLWGLLGLLMILFGSFVRDLIGARVVGGIDYANLAGGLVLAFGIVILLIALLEILTGIFAWRGSGFARFIGIVYGLIFGLGSLLPLVPSSGADVSGRPEGALIFLAFAVGYLYTLVVFIFRWRSRA